MAKSLGRGRYDIQDVLGNGRWATVHKCYDSECDERVAVKVLKLDASTDPLILREMFNREVRALEGFAHPHVIGLKRHHDFFEDRELLLVLDLVERGQTLDKLYEGSPVDWPLDWRLQQALGILDALEHAHQRGVIHRDLKPSNLLVNFRERTLRISDFGIAQIAAHYARGDASMTLRAFYSRPFAAPEQRLEEHSTPASDLYAFGWVLAGLLQWRRMVPEDTALSAVTAFTAQGDTATLLGTHAQVLGELVTGLLQDDPAGRPRLVEVKRALETVLAALTPVLRVAVDLSTKMIERMVDCGRRIPQVLADLNASPQVVLDKGRDGKADSLRWFGATSVVRLVRGNDHQSLFAIDWYEAEPDKLAKDSWRAVPASFRLCLSEPTCTADALIEFAEQNHRQQLTQRSGLAARKDFVALATATLEIQREKMTVLWARYQAVSSKPAEELEPWKQALLSKGAKPDGEQLSTQGEFAQLKLAKVWAKSAEDEPDGDLPIEDWVWATLERDGASYDVEIGKQSLGSVHGLDAATSVVTVKTTRGPSVASSGVLKLYDKQLEVALKRQESALGGFLNQLGANPNLAERLLEPESNTLEPRPPIEPVQAFLADDSETKELVRRALAARDLYFLQGPPGTGKTTFIAEVIAQILQAEPDARILLTSQSNEAVDNAVERIHKLRQTLGAEWRILRDRRGQDGVAGGADGFEQAFAAWSKGVAMRCKDGEMGALEALPGSVNNTAAMEALKRWRERIGKFDDVRKDYAASIHLWAMTLLRVPRLENLLEDDVAFDYVIVDEAGRATVSEVLVALIRGRRAILVGDHLQLPPFLDDETRRGLRTKGHDGEQAGISLFEQLFDQLPEANRGVLCKQFRMHPSIGNLIGQLYYPKIGLKNGTAHAERPLPLERLGGQERVWWCPVSGGERQYPGSKSWWNDQEGAAIEKLLDKLDRELDQTSKEGQRYSVGVIATYRDQVHYLQRQLNSKRADRWKRLTVTVATVDAFQGREQDIILLSVVRSGSRNAKFIADVRRMNVAFSRARSLLVIVGDRGIGGYHDEWQRVIEAIPDSQVLDLEGGL